MKRIAILGEFNPTITPHLATNNAIEHSCGSLGIAISGEWISTGDISIDILKRYSGVWVAPGSPVKNLASTLRAIQHAREAGIPCLGTCGGFQYMILEYARNVLNFKDAQHAEHDPYASELFISQLVCCLAGREMRLSFVAGSKVADIYESVSATEKYYCNFGVNPSKISLLASNTLRITVADAEGQLRVIELPGHPFFLGTLFVPQVRSTAGNPHPLVSAFLRAVERIDSDNVWDYEVD